MNSTIAREHVSLRKLLWVGPLTIIVAAIVNSVVRMIAVAFFGVPETFQYLQFPSVIGSTIVFLLLALLAFVIVSRSAQHPIRFYRNMALIALFVSFLSPVMLLLGLLPVAGMNVPIFWTMMVMHCISAFIVIGLLTTLTCE